MAEFLIKASEVDEKLLVPLVPEGRNREEVLAELIEAWATPIDREMDWASSMEESPGVSLNRTDLVDANTGEAIDLAWLLAAITRRLDDLGRLPASAEGGKHKPLVPGVSICLRGCRIRSCDTRPLDAPLEARYDFIAVGCTFVSDTRFDRAAFSGEAWFDDTAFSGDASFGRAAFSREASFARAAFSGDAQFGNATFSDDAWFGGAAFSRRAWFDRAAFSGGASFARATFSDKASFAGAAFSGDAWFGGVSFARAAFSGDAWFTDVAFSGDASFADAAFSGRLEADGCTAAKPLSFVRCHFSDQAVLGKDALNCAIFYTNSRDCAIWERPLPEPKLLRLWYHLWTIGNAKLHWGIVRGFGELAILNRISLSALVVVPILAGLWPAIQAALQRYAAVHWNDGLATRVTRALVGGFEHAAPVTNATPATAFLPKDMPWSWGAVFFAALFVILGRVIYQAACPQFVRERSRFDVMRSEMDDFRKTRGEESSRRLQEAIDAIEEAGTDDRVSWFWHQNLVRHNGRPVWIPSRVEDFVYTRRELPTREPPDEFDPRTDKRRPTAPETMSQTSREDVAIQQGASARYDLIARQNLGGARAALWCYVLAVLLVVLVVWRQALVILDEVGFGDSIVWVLNGHRMLFVGLAIGTIAAVVDGVWDLKLDARLKKLAAGPLRKLKRLPEPTS